MKKNEMTLEQVRKRIDDIDKALQALIVERAQCVINVGEIKKSNNEEPVFYRPEREAQILKNVMSRPCEPLAKEEMAKIFRTIMSSCLALQQPLTIAFLGPEGTFSQSAALKHFGSSIQLYPVHSIHEVFECVQSKQANFGIVPIENSIGGMINATMDACIETTLTICGEVSLPIHQNLLVSQQNKSVERIYAHEQSLLQCRKWLKRHYPLAEQIAVSSNSHAANLIVNDEHAGAIGGELAQQRYNLKALYKRIEDEGNNTTRFLVLGHHPLVPTDDDRTSLLASISNHPGALENLIKPFSRNAINITLIKSQAAQKHENQFIFFLDVDAHQEDKLFKKTLEELQSHTLNIKILGSYPKALM